MLPIGVWLRDFQAYVRGLGPIGYFVYAVGYGLIGTIVPASILTLGAGAIFGPVAGAIVVIIGATIAASLSFFLARTILRHRVETWTAKNAKFHAVDRAIAHEGAKIVLLVRLAAVFPFLFMNYAFGLTGIRFNRYIIATIIGVLPGTIAFVSLGAAGAELATQHTTKTIFLVVGAVLALVVSIFVARIAARAIRHAGVE
jgi:uncharacterized membrane protein YdjX (TVP38/TMEM64 family)